MLQYLGIFCIFPAQAGLNLNQYWQHIEMEDIPRTGGVEPKIESLQAQVNQYSPHRRG